MNEAPVKERRTWYQSSKLLINKRVDGDVDVDGNEMNRQGFSYLVYKFHMLFCVRASILKSPSRRSSLTSSTYVKSIPATALVTKAAAIDESYASFSFY